MPEYSGGVTALTIPDNLRSGVTTASYCAPELNARYAERATHYGTVVLPTRVAAPRDKAQVETAVQIVERELLAARRPRLDALNGRPDQKLAGSRRSIFTRIATEVRHDVVGPRHGVTRVL